MSRRAAAILFLHRAILRFYPAEFRRVLGPDLLASYAERVQRHTALGGPAALRNIGGDLAGAMAGAMAERLRPRDCGWAAHALTGLGNDLRIAARGLLRAPAFALVAIATLAVGIGLDTSIFSMVHAVLLRPLPYSEPDTLVALEITFQGQSWWSASPAEVEAWREGSQALESIAYGQSTDLGVVDSELPRQVPGARVTQGWFETLGVQPALGRTFIDRDAEPGNELVAVLGHGYWKREHGTVASVLGTRLRVDGVEAEVVGVLPESYRADFLDRPDIYLPLQLGPEARRDRGRVYTAVGRLASGIGMEAAQADLDAVAQRLEERHPEAMAGWGVRLVSLERAIVGDRSPLLWSLLAGVSLVLLVACANVANLLLARGLARAPEFALRTALGATRKRLFRQLLVENLLLAAVGGAGGLLLAAWSLPFFLRLAPTGIPRIDETRLDPVVLAFTVGMSLLTGLTFAMATALRGSGSKSAGELQWRHGEGHRRASRALVAIQMGLIALLLIGASLMLQSLRSLQAAELGFPVEGRLLVPIDRIVAGGGRVEPEEVAAFHRELHERVEALPGVTSVATVTRAPLTSALGQTAYHLIEGRDHGEGEAPTGGFEVVSDGYFRLMGMSTTQGRGFSSSDNADANPVVVVNDALAARYFPERSPIGARIALGRSGPNGVAQYREIVGVVAGVRYAPGTSVRPRLYVPESQNPVPVAHRDLLVLVERGDPLALAPAIREVVAALDSAQAIGTPRRFHDLRSAALGGIGLQTLLVGLFGLVALALGLVGVYGVVAYAVTRRSHEMGVRVALGARGSDVLRTVLADSMATVACGVVGGVGLAAALSRTLGSFLHGVSATDPITYATVAAAVLFAALVASLVPARRATAVDPVKALRGP